MSQAAGRASWLFSRVALIVTGRGESQFLADLFRGLAADGDCMFEVTRRVPQLRPITSTRRLEKMVGKEPKLTTRDEEIGLEARACLQSFGFDCVILIDDLEHSGREYAREIYQRYRRALDQMLQPLELDAYGSVHFLVNMLEAYYFADAASLNAVLGTDLADHDDDVETIRHPKGELEQIYPGFREIEHGREIVRRLQLKHVLSRTNTCASLRTLVAWCAKAIGRTFDADYCLDSGIYSPLTGPQIGRLP